MLEVSLRHAFEDFTLDVEFNAPPGVTVLFGRSGSGKTTVVNAVAGLLTPDVGRVATDDWVLLDTTQRIRLKPHHRRLGYIFQEGRLFPHLTVKQNLAYGAWFAPRHAPREDMSHVVEMLGIGPLLNRRPGALSGGEKQRVAIGRALLAAPRLILADEPLAALDDARKAEILPYFERLRDEVSVPILYVSHSASEVARLATTVVALRDGQVAAVGTPGEVLGDVGAMGARGAASVLKARVARHHADGLSELSAAAGPLWLPRIDAPEGAMIQLRITAQDVILSRARPEGLSALNILKGTVTEIRAGQGPGMMVLLDVGGDRLSARITRRSAEAMALAVGQSCHAIVKTVSVGPEDVGRPLQKAADAPEP